MNFNSAEWIAAATFDLFLRVTYSVLASFHILLIPLAFKISLIHLALLSSTSVLLRAFVRKPISSGLAAVLITNIVFAFIFISTWILLIKEGSQTVCYGVEPKCDWVNGETGEPIELEGPHGRFRIATAGGMPELPYAFLYEGDQHRFLFYADIVASSPPEFDIAIKGASVERLEGPTPRFSREEIGRIQDSIAHCFNHQQFHSTRDLITGSLDRPRKIIFAWGIES